MSRWSRRRFLRGVLGGGAAVTVGLPLFDSMLGSTGRALADGTPLPRRFGLFFWGNGMQPEHWVPAKTGPDYELSTLLAPLAAVREYLTVITGFEIKTPNQVTHHSGAAGVMCGTGLEVGGQSDYRYPGPSLDQVLAQQIGGETKYRSLEVGSRPGHGLSLSAPEVWNPPITSPLELYERLFGNGSLPTGEDGAPDPRLLMRQSVLDAVITDARSLEMSLSASDRARLEQQLDTIRDLEQRLAKIAQGGPPPEACVVPPAPGAPVEGSDHEQVVQTNRALVDLSVMALACDQVRVLSNFLTSPLSNVLWEGIDDGHHTMTHHEPGDQPQVQQIVTYVMMELAYMLEAMAAVPEGDGTLLDSCAVLATSDVCVGRIHNLDEFPLLVAGSCGGRLKQGTHIRSEVRDNVNKVTLSIMRACGALLPSWGTDEGYTEDGLSEMEA